MAQLQTTAPFRKAYRGATVRKRLLRTALDPALNSTRGAFSEQPCASASGCQTSRTRSSPLRSEGAKAMTQLQKTAPFRRAYRGATVRKRLLRNALDPALNSTRGAFSEQ